jgi:hypothetical protein
LLIFGERNDRWIMKYWRQLLVTVLILCFATAINAQTNSDAVDVKTSEGKVHHALGIAAGTSTGYGISYRFFYSRFSVLTVAAPFYGDAFDLSSYGLSFIYQATNYPQTNLLVYQGNRFLTDQFGVESITNGAGIGLEYNGDDNIVLNFMFGFAGYDSFRSIYPSVEAGVFFKF